MSIQGQGISTRVAYTHKNYREGQRLARYRIRTLQHRNEMCRKLDITMQEYLFNWQQWRLLRRDVAAVKRRFEDAGRYDQLEDWLAKKAADREVNKRRYADERVKKKAADDFAAFLSPPVD